MKCSNCGRKLNEKNWWLSDEGLLCKKCARDIQYRNALKQARAERG